MTDDITAQAELEALEQSIVDGNEVAPEALAVARERVTIAGLWRKGQEARAAARAQREADEVKADAKRRVTAMFNDEKAPDALVAEREAAAAQALRDLVAAHDARNALIREAIEIYRAAGLPQPAIRGQIDLLDVPGLDRQAYVRYGPGMDFMYIVEGGREHGLSGSAASIRRIIADLIGDGISVGVKL